MLNRDVLDRIKYLFVNKIDFIIFIIINNVKSVPSNIKSHNFTTILKFNHIELSFPSYTSDDIGINLELT